MSAPKVIGWVVVVLAVLIGVLLLIPAFMPRTFEVEREVVIDRPRTEVFAYFRDLKHQPEFSKWARIDPTMKSSVRGPEGAVGSVYTWTSENPEVGAGELEITALDDDSRIDLEIRITKPFQASNPTSVTFESSGAERTRVKQVYHGKMAYPMNVMCPMVVGTVSEGMEESLRNLKTVLERANARPM